MHGRAAAIRSFEKGQSLARTFFPELTDRLQPQQDVIRRRRQEIGTQSVVKQLAAGFLGVEELLIVEDRRIEFQFAIVDCVNLPPGAVQVAREGKQLEKKQSLAVIRGVRLDFLELAVDGRLELTGLVGLPGVHDRSPSFLWKGDCSARKKRKSGALA